MSSYAPGFDPTQPMYYPNDAANIQCTPLDAHEAFCTYDTALPVNTAGKPCEPDQGSYQCGIVMQAPAPAPSSSAPATVTIVMIALVLTCVAVLVWRKTRH